MTAGPEMLDLAHRLLVYEASAGNGSEAGELATVRVYEKLRRSLIEFVGEAGFQSLESRALTLARPESSGSGAAGHGTSWSGAGKIEADFHMDKEWAGEVGILLIGHLLGLLRMFLGEALTLRLLRNAWPGEVFDDGNTVHGRKA